MSREKAVPPRTPELRGDDAEELTGLWSLAWAVEFLYHARNHLLGSRHCDRHDITAWQLLYAAGERVLGESQARADRGRKAA